MTVDQAARAPDAEFEDVITLWKLGDWETIRALELDTFAGEEGFARVLAIGAIARFQLGDCTRATHLIGRAIEAGASKTLVAEFLLSGAENSLGLAARVIGHEIKSDRHFEASQSLAGSGSSSPSMREARVRLQIQELIKRSKLGATLNASRLTQSVLLPSQEEAATPGRDLGLLKQNIKAEIQADLRANNPNPYAHNRTLTPALNKSLRDFASQQLGLTEVKPAYIDYLATKAIQVEKSCVGRLATTVQDAVARQLVAECVPSIGKLVILEIGALYGISLAILYNHVVTRFPSVRLVCLDPFDGYYGKAIDAVLNQPVNDLTFHRNMTLANVPKDDYQVIKLYSNDPQAIESAKQLGIDLLIIDGDHSYEGVKFDFDNYFPFVKPGGYVVLDDYNAKEWPGVQQFVDEDLPKVSGYRHLGSISRTAVGRRGDG